MRTKKEKFVETPIPTLFDKVFNPPWGWSFDYTRDVIHFCFPVVRVSISPKKGKMFEKKTAKAAFAKIEKAVAAELNKVKKALDGLDDN